VNRFQEKATKVDNFLGKVANRSLAFVCALFWGFCSYGVFTSDDFKLFSVGGVLCVCIAGVFACVVVYLWRSEESLTQFLGD